MNIEEIRLGKLKHLPGANLEDEDLSNTDLSRVNLAGAH
ncbi:MAG: pentapeptide repeat-containing protein, partial [Brasilonema sp.]